MSWDNKIIWSEGMFLRPQHFQQFDRYVTKFVHAKTSSLRGNGWGVVEIQLNQEMLGLGKIAIERARGVLEDGTPFSIPHDADLPAPYEPPGHVRETLIHLAVAVHQPGAVETDARNLSDNPVRYTVADQAVTDANAGDREDTTVEVARLRFQLLPDGAERSGFVCLPIARLVEVRADRQVILDAGHVPPLVDCAASPILANMITEIRGLLHHRGTELAARVSQSGTSGVAEISDFLLLQMINRHEPVFSHMSGAVLTHPETLYQAMLQLAGELATYFRSEKRPTDFGFYRHQDLAATFKPVIEQIRRSLSAVLEQSAIRIPLRELKYGVQVAEVEDRTLFTTANFILTVRADVEVERLRREFPSQIKIGPAEKIKELVNVALPGIKIYPVPVAPRQIPFNVGVVYFEIDQQSPYWKEMRHSGSLAMHVAGEFPDIEMALWAIRSH